MVKPDVVCNKSHIMAVATSFEVVRLRERRAVARKFSVHKYSYPYYACGSTDTIYVTPRHYDEDLERSCA